jgi:ribonucleotide reductase alpha subunit
MMSWPTGFYLCRVSDYAEDFAKTAGYRHPVKTRAIAPTGTIGIVAETTTGIEPIFCVAFKRRVERPRLPARTP